MVVVGFLVIVNILERFEDVRSNKKECLDLLKEMLKLAELVKEFKELMGEMQDITDMI
jgi:2-hydroxy-3-keto-5-methylthiopentenyl-1-phosphate phosphatase